MSDLKQAVSELVSKTTVNVRQSTRRTKRGLSTVRAYTRETANDAINNTNLRPDFVTVNRGSGTTTKIWKIEPQLIRTGKNKYEIVYGAMQTSGLDPEITDDLSGTQNEWLSLGFEIGDTNALDLFENPAINRVADKLKADALVTIFGPLVKV